MSQEHIVRTWLRFLHVEQYSDSFIENGYDDMETVKLIAIEDLEAIGVSRHDHKKYLLENVRMLRENGAAWVYCVTCPQPNPDHEDNSFSNYCDWSDVSQNSASSRSSKETDLEYPDAIITQSHHEDDQESRDEDSRSIFRQIRQWICQRHDADFEIGHIRPTTDVSSSAPLRSVISSHHPTQSSYSFSTLQPRHSIHKQPSKVGQFSTPVVPHKVYSYKADTLNVEPTKPSYKVDTTVKFRQQRYWSDSATESNV